MYHRIDNTLCDPWELAVSPENFEQHLQSIKKNWNVFSMDHLTDSITKKDLPKNAIAITFDDGYLDNYTNAAPLLEKYNLPATFFITTGSIGTNDQFWWDELQDLILLNETLPKTINLILNNEALAFDLLDENYLTPKLKSEIKNWNAEQPPVNRRTELYFLLCKKIQPNEPGLRKKILQEIKQWAGVQSHQSGTMMNWEQIQLLSDNRLFSIGAHTVNHPALAAHPILTQRKEILDGKMDLQKRLNKEIGGFAYPHGNYNQETISILREGEFDYAVTTEPRYTIQSARKFELPRFQVKNWNENTFNRYLKQWQSAK
jgi:peptidoglycan/xylan/chitin deacetylase (PgdA/CDA1 family)